MQVTIDGIQYVPAPPQCDNPELLDIRFFSDDLDREVSVREYLRALLATLWMEGESFSGKYPFGNSGWQWDLRFALVLAGHVKGEIVKGGEDEDDDVIASTVDVETADEIIRGLITAMCAP